MDALVSKLISLGLFKYLGIGALGTLIWYAGPYIEFLRPAKNRLITIAVVAVLYLAYLLISKLLLNKKAKMLANDLAVSTGPETASAHDRSSEELATLKKKFDEALLVLRSSGKGKFSQGSLYSLPWYMIIGPPGAGKTTLLVNSGLQFPLAEKMGLSKLQGVGGTRFCDWWFTDEAVIVDTAGRYTTQDSDEKVDNAAWLGFLSMLRKNRKRRPINGIIVAISINDLTRQSEVERERSATAVTQRIQELYEQLGVRFPVYVMFTKCDLMSGFMEFFGDLDRHEREEVWGTTFQLNANVLEQLDAEYRLLQTQLQSRLVQRLQQERDPYRRNLIYNFPNLFNAAKPLVLEFVEQIYKPSRYTVTPFLRGIYFTSGTQEGTPFNRLISQLSRSFGLSNISASGGTSQGKSYFIRHLLGKVIFRESGLAGANLKAERVFALMRTGGFIALAVVPLILVTLWWVSYSKNQEMMEELLAQSLNLDKQIELISPNDERLVSVLQLLNEARELNTGYAAMSDAAPLSMRFGLYQGDKLARNATLPAYRRLLENAFLSRLLVRIEQHLREVSNDPDLAYPALKAYLMLADDQRLDPELIKLWVTKQFRQDFGSDVRNEQFEQMLLHLDALLELRPFNTPFDLDENLVELVRSNLRRTSPAQRAYAIIKSELLTQGSEFTIAAVGGPEASRALYRASGEYLTRGVPAMFSPDGYYKSFLPTKQRVIDEHENEFWIFRTEALGASATSSTELSQQVSRQYFQDYIDTWWQFLEDIRILQFNSFEDAAQILQIIGSENSPLVLVLQGAIENTRLSPGQAASEDSAPDSQQIDVTPGEANPIVVDNAFQSLAYFVEGNNNQPSPLESIKQDVVELQFFLSDLANSGSTATSPAVQQQMRTTVDKLQRSAGYAPKPVGEWLGNIAEQSKGIVAGKTANALNTRWRSEVVPFCEKAIANRYPISQRSEAEISLQDFGRFFGPGGILNQFFDENLADLVNTNSTPWTSRPDSGGVRISSASLRALQSAHEIRQSFFIGRGELPSTSFDLKPVRMDEETTHFLLNIDGQKITYSHDMLQSTGVDWPNTNSYGQVQIQFSAENNILASETKHGAWAWFRLLSDSDIQASNNPEQYKVTFTLGNHWIIFDLKARSAFNPFKLSQFQQFSCVSNL